MLLVVFFSYSLQTIQTQGLQNQTAVQSLSYLSPGTQQTQSLNSQSQRVKIIFLLVDIIWEFPFPVLVKITHNLVNRKLGACPKSQFLFYEKHYQWAATGRYYCLLFVTFLGYLYYDIVNGIMYCFSKFIYLYIFFNKMKHCRRDWWKDLDLQQNEMRMENHCWHLSAPGYDHLPSTKDQSYSSSYYICKSL